MENKKNNDVSYLRFNKDRNWRNFLQCKSILESLLSQLSNKSEEELTKRDLLSLISANFDYMRALSLYNYYKDLLAQYNANKVLEDNESSEE